MPAYRLTPDAQSDIIGIRQYTVQQWGETQSQAYLSELRQTIRLIAATPSLGKGRPDVGKEVLSFPYSSHVIYYIVHDKQLVVFGVLHKRMLPERHLSERETT
ncbi:type II toxin-antitoxin system RelE/ParE family toxin [Nitrincola iocasae]|jgi:toxin ParE1/3/4|uniref:Toxin n=1 Tax=Nitrincola iocasae TaxID=2614693 RepID=A0A5J6LCL2_9GAMM|nr:type II toxin-antitoxin system RelE/ParE family toxin [Nitrincola iocasae]QEW05952.1 type II toxin-antitoxin system RelE/ParE family toxin [Nitrincola iocasae]